jgi:hypothetical protein
MLRIPYRRSRDAILLCPRNQQIQCLHRLDLSETVPSIDRKYARGLLVDGDLSLRIDKAARNPLQVNVESRDTVRRRALYVSVDQGSRKDRCVSCGNASMLDELSCDGLQIFRPEAFHAID